MSDLPAALQSAFARTHYDFTGPLALLVPLRIGQMCGDLLALYQQTGANCAACLTAWNPWSEAVSDEDNATAQRALAASLQDISPLVLTGFGQEPGSSYPGEAHLLALGVSRDTAIAFGRQYQQNAIVWAGADAIPQLVLLR